MWKARVHDPVDRERGVDGIKRTPNGTSNGVANSGEAIVTSTNNETHSM